MLLLLVFVSFDADVEVAVAIVVVLAGKVAECVKDQEVCSSAKGLLAKPTSSKELRNLASMKM